MELLRNVPFRFIELKIIIFLPLCVISSLFLLTVNQQLMINQYSLFILPSSLQLKTNYSPAANIHTHNKNDTRFLFDWCKYV
jgi:hypothetical protein